jgi:NAD(P)-dependent dehydrogenase (short-subunit alcohol dehydrogenase family)
MLSPLSIGILNTIINTPCRNKEIFDIFNTNVLGSFNIARAAIKHLRAAAASGSGRNTALANFGSLGSWQSSSGVAACMSIPFPQVIKPG